MGKGTLGEFEQEVLLAVLHLGDDAYSVPIVLELEERTGREVSSSAVYVALRRLEEKGLASSELREPPGDEKGRSRRYFGVTERGIALLRETRRRLRRLWEGLDPVLEEGT